MKNSKHGALIVTATAAIVGAQVIAGIAIYIGFTDWAARGQFGDMFGAVNTLFSGLAFAGVVYAILLQREDLALQREELALTRKELTRSAEAQEKSELALTAQAEASRQSARLAMINSLVDHYDKQLSQYRNMAFGQNDPRNVQVQEWTRKRLQLLRLMDDTFDVLANDNQHRDLP